MKKTLVTGLAAFALTAALRAAEFHVATAGNDAGPGSRAAPFRTIQHAADRAQPGDTITVHAGIYRERVNPPRGGTSEQKRIVYQAAPGASVAITGSEPVKKWMPVTNDTWQAVLPNSFFGTFNPYRDLIHGDWFSPKGREHHTGAVYLNGDWLTEAANREETLEPAKANALWSAAVDATNTTIWAQFPCVNPNDANVEINVRQTVFTPDKTGINYITVRGFTLRNAATPWAPPTAGQIGLLTAYWCKGWIIENNDIAYSTCSGVALGKYSDEWDNRAGSASGYVGTLNRALSNGWNKATVGGHTVRNNRIAHCEQAGIVGSLGCSFSTVEGNVIHDIHIRQLFTGAEMAGIKFHGAIDTVIRHNHIYRTNRGVWMDWMAQGTRISCNLLHDNSADEDLFMEVDHGPFVVDNNIFLSRRNVMDVSEGGAYAHNLFAGTIMAQPDGRTTPFHVAHSTTVVGLKSIAGGDDRFYNNIFVGDGIRGADYGLAVYDQREAPLHVGGNVYYNGAHPYSKEVKPLVLADKDPSVKLVEKDGLFLLQCNLGAELGRASTVLVTTELLGKASVPKLPYENPDGSPLVIDRDYFGTKRDPHHPAPGPFAKPGHGDLNLKVW